VLLRVAALPGWPVLIRGSASGLAKPEHLLADS
jgi:hypothetical protein